MELCVLGIIPESLTTFGTIIKRSPSLADAGGGRLFGLRGPTS